MRRPLVLLAIVLLASNCERKSTARLVEPPQNVVTPTPQRYIQGTVRLGDWSSSPGAPVNTAKVWLGSAYSHAVFSDTLGRYALAVDFIGPDSLTVFASNGYTPGMVYAVKCSGFTKFMPASWGAVNVDVRLDHCSPI